MKFLLPFALLLSALFLGTGFTTPSSTAIDVSILPAVFENNLIYVKVPVNKKDTLLFYTDTGGKNFLYKQGLKKLKVRYKKENLWRHTGFDTLFPKAGVPLPGVAKMYKLREKTKEDGMLGREWFREKIWEFDYNVEQLRVLPELDGTCIKLTDLTFIEDSYIKKTDKCGRFFMLVEGESFPMLFDTGAQVKLSANAKTKLNQPELIAGSFISAITFDKWTAAHPEWEVIKGGDVSVGTEDLIKVPELRVGEVTIGPVWFAKRSDENFVTLSSMCTNLPVVGAMGGNALSQFGSIIADYPGQKLYIRR